MPMYHKAYAFDWRAFERDALHGLLLRALATGDPAGLIAYIENNREGLKDPYEGDPLGEDWQATLENRDVHEYADFALTRFYDPAEDWGIGPQWQKIDALRPEADRQALLGFPLGREHRFFDPGREGSYFQTPEQATESLDRIRRFDLSRLQQYQRKSLRTFQTLLEECVETGLGVYVTF